MYNLTTGLITILILCGQIILAQCPLGNITLTTQTEVDAFATSYPSCTDLPGNITIHGAAIINVDGLINLQSIAGDLIIKGPNNITNLDGLQNLVTIGGKLEIKGSNKLNSLSGLSSLSTVSGTMTIMQNDALTDCSELCTLLDGLGVSGTIKIQHNDSGCNSEVEVNTECALIALPVEMISFSGHAMKRTNILKWQTASEENTMIFIVERSLNGKSDFKEIDRINAIGYSDVIQSYEIEDNSPFNLAYYRLRIVDFDGYFEYSDLVVIKRTESEEFEIEVFPVPAKDEVVVLIPVESNSSAIFTLANFTGQILIQDKIELKNGVNRLTINLSDFNTNLYFLSIDNGNKTIVKKILKAGKQ